MLEVHEWYADDAAEKQPQVLRSVAARPSPNHRSDGDLSWGPRLSPCPLRCGGRSGIVVPMSENPEMGHPWSCGSEPPCKAGPSTSPSLRSGFSRDGIVLSNPCDGDKSQGWGTEFRRDGGDVKSDSSGAEALRLCDAFQGPEGPCSLRECRPTWDRAFPPLATETGRKDGARRRFAD